MPPVLNLRAYARVVTTLAKLFYDMSERAEIYEADERRGDLGLSPIAKEMRRVLIGATGCDPCEVTNVVFEQRTGLPLTASHRQGIPHVQFELNYTPLRQRDQYRPAARSNEALGTALLLVDVVVPAEVIEAWSLPVYERVREWATAEHLAANDNDVPRVPKPDFLNQFPRSETWGQDEVRS